MEGYGEEVGWRIRVKKYEMWGKWVDDGGSEYDMVKMLG